MLLWITCSKDLCSLLLWITYSNASLYEQFHEVVFKQKIGLGHFGSQYEYSQAVYSYTWSVAFQYLTTPRNTAKRKAVSLSFLCNIVPLLRFRA